MQNEKMSPPEFVALLQKLLNEKIPTDNLIALGSAIATLGLDDWRAVGKNIFLKDIKPIYQSTKKKTSSIKELKNTIKKEGAKSFLKTLSENSKNLIQGQVHNARINVPEAKNRLTRFVKKIGHDYNHLATNEDRGNYILKLSLYSGVFAMAFQKGAKHKMLSRSTIPLIVLGFTLVFVNRILEQAEEKLTDRSGALKLSQDLRSLLRTLNMGLTSGMTLNVVVDGIVDQNIQINDLNGKSLGSLMPKSIIDNMIYTTLMGLFSNEKKAD